MSGEPSLELYLDRTLRRQIETHQIGITRQQVP
jgi:hypothetical protein